MTHRRGQISAKMAITIVIVLAVTALVAGFLLPIALDTMNDDKTVSITQDNGTTEAVNPELDATLDDVSSGTPNTATYTLASGGESVTNTIDQGSSADFDFDRGTVTVTVDDTTLATTDSATATYDYPRDFAYSGAARSMWGILGAIIVLCVVLFVLSYAMRKT